jgi:MerR family copper efflux transcriptional regulator
MIFIGEASKLSGASVKAIRHYEKLGLIANLERSGIYRTFLTQDVDTIRLIKEAQKIGFKLSELKEVFDLNDSSPWIQIEKLIRLKESQVKLEIASLKEKQVRLNKYSKLISDCLSEDPNCSKPLIEQIP